MTSKYAATIAVVTCTPSGSSDSALTLSSTSVRSNTTVAQCPGLQQH
ncbi:hypothetical protein ACFXKH_08185 [Streptomyces caelestis]